MLSDGFDVGSRRQRRRHVPRQQLVDAVDRMVSDALENIGEICLGIEAVQARRADQAIHRGSTFVTGVGAGEQVIPSAEGDAAQHSLGDQVVDFRAPVAAVVNERRPAIQRILNRLGCVGFCRERRERCFTRSMTSRPYLTTTWNRSKFGTWICCRFTVRCGTLWTLTVVDNYTWECLSHRGRTNSEGQHVVQAPTCITGMRGHRAMIKVDKCSELISKAMDR
ncbi:hypothetical protein DFS13_13925 [Burkholderia sp. 28_3]|nr:hypothetical protein DFS13_13925 [Burkholderia sp. 28_3]RAS39702.1 hypothetical protein DFS07_14025 [Burkholderia cenocepacia]